MEKKFTPEQKENEDIFFIYESIKEQLKEDFGLEITRPAEAFILKKAIKEVENERQNIKELRKNGKEIQEGINPLTESLDRFFKRAYGVDIFQYGNDMKKVFPEIRSFQEKRKELGGMSLWQRLGKMIKEEREKRELL